MDVIPTGLQHQGYLCRCKEGYSLDENGHSCTGLVHYIMARHQICSSPQILMSAVKAKVPATSMLLVKTAMGALFANVCLASMVLV